MRLSTSVALVASSAVIAALLPAVAAESVSAVPMCQGHRATIVGDPADRELNGTAGDDVIVTRGVASVRAEGGSDRICVTGTTTRDGETNIDAGPGADRVRVVTSPTGRLNAVLGEGDDRMVVATTPTHRIYARLGAGRDVYRGGPGPDFVNADAGSSTGEHDRISTGAGPDHVAVGRWRSPTHDEVELGAGDDQLRVHGWLTPAARPRGGAGSDAIRPGERCAVYPSEPGCQERPEWVVDNVRGVATVDGVVQSRWSGFEVFDLFNWNTGPVTFVGGDADEVVRVEAGGLVGATMGAGDDYLLMTTKRIEHQGEISGGPGRDTLDVYGWGLTVDLAAGVMWERHTGSATDPSARFAGFENATGASSHGSTLIGDGGDNDLRGSGCNAKLDGGAGDDDLLFINPTPNTVPCLPPGRDAHFHGGPGADVLHGGWGPDRLDGGGGFDTVYGSRGRDVCIAAEVQHSCER